MGPAVRRRRRRRTAIVEIAAQLPRGARARSRAEIVSADGGSGAQGDRAAEDAQILGKGPGAEPDGMVLTFSSRSRLSVDVDGQVRVD
jgi:hypothetical protein